MSRCYVKACGACLLIFGVMLAGVTSVRASLVGHWKLDEGSGNVTASAIHSPQHDGTLQGARWITENLPPVPSGSTAAVEFDAGAGDVIVTGFEGVTGTAARSVSAWIRADASQPEFACIVGWGVNATGQRNTFRLNVSPANGTMGALRFEVQGGYVTGSTPLTDGIWHHVAMVLPANASVKDVKLYVDGVLEEVTGESSGNPAVNTAAGSSVVLAGSPHSTAYNFSGAIDEVRIYDHALTEAEIAQLATAAPDLILSFTASPPAVDPGQAVTLAWQVSAVDSIRLEPGIGDVGPLTTNGVGSLDVLPSQTTLYTLTVQSNGVTDLATVQVVVSSPPDVRINEIMADNQRTLDDEDGDDPDWIELINLGGRAQNLAGWYLTDSTNDLRRWKFPEVWLGPGETLIVFASGKDRRVPDRPLHTNFKLDGDGEYLALVKPDGATVADAFAPAYPPLPTDISYGLPSSGTNRVYFTQPTPGAANGLGTLELGPVITRVTDRVPRPNRDPSQGPVDEEIIVTAEVRPTLHAVGGVTLFYRVMFAAEQSVAMRDDGLPPDSMAADGIYTASMPLAGLQNGQMLRWRVEARDDQGTASLMPPYPDPNDSPQYFGTVARRSGSAGGLPVLEWFVENPGAADTRTGTRASLYYLDEFYDNIFVRIRGGTTTGLAKKSYKFEFNKGHPFRFAEDVGRVTEFNLNTTYTDKTYVRMALSFEVYDMAGAPGCVAFPVRVDQNGQFHGILMFIEQVDRDLLAREGLDPRGALYKMYNTGTSGSSSVEKKNRREENNSDLITFLSNLNNLSGAALENYIFDHVNVPVMLNYLAATVLSQNNDCMAKNYYLYRDSDGTGEWFMLPWDVDLTFGRHFMTDDSILGDTIWADEDYVLGGRNRNVPISPSHPFMGTQRYPGNRSWNRIFEALFKSPRFTEMYRRRLRTLMDEILQPPGTPAEQRRLEALLDAWAAQLGDDAERDRQKWGQYGQPQTLQQAMDILKREYLDVRRVHLFVTHAASNADQYPYPPSQAESALLPDAQQGGLRIAFGQIEFNPASGNQEEEYIQLTNANPVAVDLSGWRITGGIQHTFAPGVVVLPFDVLYLSPNVPAFRARSLPPHGGQGLLVQGNYRGNLSARGETLRLEDASGRLVSEVTYSGAPTAAQMALRISELMYAPPPPPSGSPFTAEDFEYVELVNIGATSLDLSGVRFVQGIQFDFTGSAVTQLDPGQRVLVVRNVGAFESRYGPGHPIAGTYTGNLDNAGERLRLLDAAGEEVLDFTYDNAWYPVTDGLGFALEVQDESASWNTWNERSQWRPSHARLGSPGQPAGPAPMLVPVVINEVLARGTQPDAVELYNPTDLPADVSGWYLTDDPGNPFKYALPVDTVIAPRGFVVFTADQFNPTPGQGTSFGLSSLGDNVYLFSAGPDGQLTGYMHGFEFGPSALDVSFGRHVTSTGKERFVAQKALTLGGPNAGPLVGPVVISEIMFHPSPDDAWAEYVELTATSESDVPLFDPSYPTNHWRVQGAIAFEFPEGMTLPAGGRVVLVGFDPASDTATLAAFRARYGVNTNTPLLGPFQGRLSNAGEAIELLRPETPVLTGPDAGRVPHFLVERVRYGDGPDWPPVADGLGAALQRKDLTAYGDDPANWTATLPSPGREHGAGQAPSFVVAPQDTTVLAGTAVELISAAAGTDPLTYQWLLDGQVIPGATQAVLRIPTVALQDGGVYQVAALNDVGWALSPPARLHVLEPLRIVQQPASQNVWPGTNVTLTVVVTSSGTPVYQWFFEGQPIPHATNATLILTNVQMEDTGLYTVRVADEVSEATSEPALVRVLVRPWFVVQPVGLSVPEGGTAVLSALADGTPPLGYRWRRNGLTIAFTQEPFLVLTNVQLTDAGVYTVVATNGVGPGTLSARVNLEVLPDSDHDGMPDAWESAHGLQPGDAADASQDADHDGLTNRQEYEAGTDPTDPDSVLAIRTVQVSRLPGPHVLIEFQAVSNRTYSVQATTSLTGADWTEAAYLLAPGSNSLQQLEVPGPLHATEFYRLVTPMMRALKP